MLRMVKIEVKRDNLRVNLHHKGMTCSEYCMIET